jgi:hypothetical protein
MKNLKRILVTLFLVSCSYTSFGQAKTIHVFVALCDNVNQGIVPVPKSLGNGQDPKSNLYWGAAFGLKSYFRYKTKDWTFVKTIASKDSNILERVVFKHAAQEAYIVADAYDGAKIKTCINDFLKASNGQNPQTIVLEDSSLTFGGKSDLVAYIGHDGLMEFSVNNEYRTLGNYQKDAMILACYSKAFFKTELKKAQARPLLWTTHLMAPEAYTLKAAIDGWLIDETGLQIEERAAQAYHKYQKCGLKGARNLFTSGY